MPTTLPTIFTSAEWQSRTQHFFLAVFVLGWIPDFVIAFAVMKLIDGGWGAFWGVWVAIQGLYLLNWMKNTLWASLAWRVWLRKRYADEALTVLRAYHFPKPESDEDDAESFFTGVMEDDEQTIAIRLAAAEWKSAAHMWGHGSIQATLRIQQAWRDAFNKYRETA